MRNASKKYPVKLIATDLDGTLLDEEKKVPPFFAETVRALYRHGIRFALVSGREHRNILRNFPGLEEILIVISNNGALCCDGDRQISDHSLSRNEIRTIWQAAGTLPDVDIVISGKEKGLLSAHPRSCILEELARICGSPEAIKQTFQLTEDPLEESRLHPVGKLAFFHHQDAWNACRKALTPFMEEYQVIPSEPCWVNLMKKGVDKGCGIRDVRHALGIQPEETIVFGDYLNDCSMFREAFHTCAVENAHPDLKRMAARIVPSNQENGVLRTIREHFDFLRDE